MPLDPRSPSLLRRTPRGTDEEVLNCEQMTENWDSKFDGHLKHFHKRTVRFMMVPVMRGGKALLYIEKVSQAVPKLLEGLDVVVDYVFILLKVVKVYVGQHERPIVREGSLDLRKFVGLKLSSILKHPLRHDDVEALFAEGDLPIQEICLNKVGRRIVDRDVNAVVVDVLSEEAHQGSGTAANVKQITLSSSRQLVYEPSAFLQPEMRLYIISILVNPEISFIILVDRVGHFVFLLRLSTPNRHRSSADSADPCCFCPAIACRCFKRTFR
jgi:hypothetical protein